MKKLAITFSLIAGLSCHVLASATLSVAPSHLLGEVPGMIGADFCNIVFPNKATCSIVYNNSTAAMTLHFAQYPEKLTDSSHDFAGLTSEEGVYTTMQITVTNSSGTTIYDGNITNKVGLKCDNTTCEAWD